MLYTKLVASSAYFLLCQVWISFIVKRFPASSCCSILQSLEQAGIFSQQGGAGGSDQRPTFFQGRVIDVTQIALFALSACCFKLIIRKILAVKCCEANFWFSTHQVHFLTFFAQINLALVESEEKIKTTKCNF